MNHLDIILTALICAFALISIWLFTQWRNEKARAGYYRSLWITEKKNKKKSYIEKATEKAINKQLQKRNSKN